jgi:uncharacterized protein YcfJ
MLSLLVGCQSNKTRVAEGSIIGGVVGAAAGGIIGHQGGHGAEGAAIGAAAGALTGALVGSQIKKPGQANQTATTASGQASQAAPQAPNPNQMSMQQVVSLVKEGVNESVIIDKIRLTNSKFSLTSADIDYLKQQGVSQKIIDAMQGQ